MGRFVVKPCDNMGSVEGLKRDRTWDVVDRTSGFAYCTKETRREAYDEARRLNVALGSSPLTTRP